MKNMFLFPGAGRPISYFSGIETKANRNAVKASSSLMKIAFCLLTVVALIVPSDRMWAQCSEDQLNTDDAFSIRNLNGQSITAACNGFLTNFTFYAALLGPNNFDVTVYEGDGCAGNTLATQIFAGIQSGTQPQPIDFYTPIPVIMGQTYTITFDPVDYIFLRIINSDDYAGGTHYNQLCNSSPAQDLKFSYEISANPPPPPPTISRTSANDPTSFDPCSCGDPLNFYDGNGDVTYFHDFVEVTSVTGETWEVTAVMDAFTDEGVTPVVVTDPLVETPPGSGIYRIDLFHAPGVGFTMTVDRTAGGGPFPLMEGGTCAACKQIPTLGQWGLILLSLLILTFGVVALRRHEPVLAGYGNVASSNKFNFPFNKAVFSKMLITVMIALAAVFVVAVTMFGYEMTSADVPGSLVAGPMLAYLLHLLAGWKNN